MVNHRLGYVRGLNRAACDRKELKRLTGQKLSTSRSKQMF